MLEQKAGRTIHLRPVQAAVAAALFALLTVIMTYPLALHPADQVRDLGDSVEQSWILAWNAKTLFTDPANLFDANVFYPFENALAFSDAQVSIGFLSAPVFWATGNAVLAYNSMVLFSFFLCGLGAFLLAHRVTGSFAGSVIAGLVFAFAPYKVAHFGHLNLLTAQWMPLSLLFLDRGWFGGKTRDWVGFTICLVLGVLASFYYAFFLAIAVALWIAYHWLFGPRPKLASLGKLGVGIVVMAAAAIPCALPYFEVQREFGFERSLGETQGLSAWFTDYIVAPPVNAIYGPLTFGLARDRTWPLEHILFPGIIPVLLAACALLPSVRSDPAPERGAVSRAKWAARLRRVCKGEQAWYVALVLFAFIMSLGPYLQISGRVTGVPLPYLFFYNYLPGFTAMRAAVRFDILVLLGLAVLAAFGVARLNGILARRPAMASFAVSLVLPVAVLVEYWSAPVPLVQVPVGDEVPKVYRWLATQPEDTAIVELPADNLEQQFRYQYFSTYHWLRIVNGHGSFLPEPFTRIMAELGTFPSDRSADLLSGLGVRYVIVHGAEYTGSALEGMVSGIEGSSRMKVVERFDDDLVVAIDGMSSDLSLVTATVSIPEQAVAGRRLDVLVSLSNSANRTMVLFPNDRVTISASWQGREAPTTSQATRMPLVVGPLGSTQSAVSIITPDSIGENVLNVTASTPVGTVSASRPVTVLPSMSDSTERDSVAATIVDCKAPEAVNAGATFGVSCSVENSGNSIWLDKAGPATGRVSLGVLKWVGPGDVIEVDSQGNTLSARGPLQFEVYPEQSVTIDMSATAPVRPGVYSLYVDLVSEHVTWFSQRGTLPYRTSVLVR